MAFGNLFAEIGSARDDEEDEQARRECCGSWPRGAAEWADEARRAFLAVEHAAHAALQTFGRDFAQIRGADHVSLHHQRLIGVGAGSAAGDVLLALQRVGGVEFAIEQAVQKRLYLLAIGLVGHGKTSPTSSRQALANASRARARRDMTVPIGASMMAAISL